MRAWPRPTARSRKRSIPEVAALGEGTDSRGVSAARRGRKGGPTRSGSGGGAVGRSVPTCCGFLSCDGRRLGVGSARRGGTRRVERVYPPDPSVCRCPAGRRGCLSFRPIRLDSVPSCGGHRPPGPRPVVLSSPRSPPREPSRAPGDRSARAHDEGVVRREEENLPSRGAPSCPLLDPLAPKHWTGEARDGEAVDFRHLLSVDSVDRLAVRLGEASRIERSGREGLS